MEVSENLIYKYLYMMDVPFLMWNSRVVFWASPLLGPIPGVSGYTFPLRWAMSSCPTLGRWERDPESATWSGASRVQIGQSGWDFPSGLSGFSGLRFFWSGGYLKCATFCQVTIGFNTENGLIWMIWEYQHFGTSSYIFTIFHMISVGIV